MKSRRRTQGAGRKTQGARRKTHGAGQKFGNSKIKPSHNEILENYQSFFLINNLPAGYGSAAQFRLGEMETSDR